MKPRLLVFPLALVLSQSIVAADFTWQGNTDTNWTEGTNWLLGAAPTYGATLTTDRLYIGSAGVGAGAVYNPGVGVTTTFESGRGIVIGSAQGAASLTVSSGTLKINGAATSGNEPIMANGVSATLLINGGNLDLTGHGFGFKFFNTAAAGLTSDLTLSSGSFSSKGFDFATGGSLGTSTINLNGGALVVTGFTKTGATTTSALNLNGGTLSIRSASSASFLPDLMGLQAIVKAGGAIIDSNNLNLTIAEVLEHDTVLGLTADGGLTKNGAGTLTVSGANTFTGPVTVNAGTSTTTSRLLLGNDTGAGTGTITLADSYTDIQLSLGRNIANPLVISDTGDQKTLIFVSAGSAECSGAITINETTTDNFRVRSDASSSLTLSGKISGGGKMTKIQSGDVYLTNAANDFTGGTKIDAGKLQYVFGALGASGNVNMNGGTLRWMPGNTQDLSARLVMVDAKTATYETGGNNVTFGTAIGNSSTANLAKTGSGQLTLTGTNSYTGTTTVNGGTLRVDGSLNAASAVSVTTGELSGIGTIGGSVTVAAAGNITPRAVGFAGTLTMGGLDVAAMAAGTGKLKFDLGANTATSDKIAVTGTLSIGADALGFSDFTFGNLTGGPQNVTYTLITSGAPISGTLNGSDLSGPIGVGGTGTLSISGNDIFLTVTGLSGNLAPTISDIANPPSFPSGGNTSALAFTITDEDLGTVTLTGSSSNTTLVPNGNIVFGGSAGSRTVTVTPASGLSGTATITITVTDAGSLTATDTFVVTVTDNYLSWATANSVTGGPDGDSDNDGVTNLIEYALVNGGERGVYSGNTITFTKRGAPYGGDVTYDIESSTLLTAGSWSTLAKPPVVESPSSISYTFTPGSPVKNFARLKVVQVP